MKKQGSPMPCDIGCRALIAISIARTRSIACSTKRCGAWDLPFRIAGLNWSRMIPSCPSKIEGQNSNRGDMVFRCLGCPRTRGRRARRHEASGRQQPRPAILTAAQMKSRLPGRASAAHADRVDGHCVQEGNSPDGGNHSESTGCQMASHCTSRKPRHISLGIAR